MIVSHEDLREIVKYILVTAGTPEPEARAVTDHLVEANLKGHDSHGVGMLPAYIRNIKMGHLIPGQHAEQVSRQGSVIVVDGKFGFGQIVGPEAMDMGIEVATKNGVAAIALKNAHHLGRIGAHAEYVASRGFISIHHVNVVGHPPQVAPFGGTVPRLGTNPFCCAIPVTNDHPVVLDMATSAIAAGKVRVAINSGELVPEGCLIDHEGMPTRNPRVVADDPPGAQIHFGKHKGFGLALIYEILAGALVGAWSAQPGNAREGTIVNHMLTFILDPEVIGDRQSFENEIHALIGYIKDTPTAKGVDEILIPGEPERISRTARVADGIPVDDVTWETIMKTGASVGIEAQKIQELLSA